MRTGYSKRLSLVAIVAGLAVGCFSPAAEAAVTGTAGVTQPDQVTPLNSGGSATPFSVVTPRGARCEGDSAHNGYFVFSYLVPKGIDPRSVSFVHIAPSRGYGLRTQSHYYGGVTTDENTGALRQTPPNFVWSRLSADQLTPSAATDATWEGGLACESPQGQVTSIWNFEILFHRNPSDPRGFTWTILHPAPPPSSGLGWLLWLVLVVLATGGTALYAFSRQRERPRQPSAPKRQNRRPNLV